MRTIELARKMAEMGQKEDAQKGYFLALQKEEDLEPKEELEAASYLFFSKWDHKLPFSIFISLYNRGFFQAELMNLMQQAFYLPNVQKQKKQYERNGRALSKYPYFFHQEFPAFEELPILFFPFDEKGYIPYFQEEDRFGYEARHLFTAVCIHCRYLPGFREHYPIYKKSECGTEKQPDF